MNNYENRQDFAYDSIKQALLRADLQPNEKISRIELGKNLRIGNTPMREAIIRLEKEGLFKILPQSGTFVSKINVAEAEQAYFVRCNIEKLVFQEACQHVTPKHIKELERMLVIQRLLSETNDNDMFVAFDDEFHQYFYQIASHLYTWKWMETISIPLMRYRYLNLNSKEPSWHEIHTEHEKIVKILKKKDTDAMGKMIEVHMKQYEPNTSYLVQLYPDYFE